MTESWCATSAEVRHETEFVSVKCNHCPAEVTFKRVMPKRRMQIIQTYLDNHKQKHNKEQQ